MNTKTDSPQNLKEIALDDMFAYKCTRSPKYKSLFLYGSAIIENKEIILNYNENSPSASFKYELPGGNIYNLSFDIYIPEEFAKASRDGEAYSDRQIILEFRSAVKAGLILKISDTGDVYVVYDDNKDETSYLVGSANSGKYNSFNISIRQSSIIKLNGGKAFELPPGCFNKIDNIVFDGCCPAGEFRFGNFVVNDKNINFDKSLVRDIELTDIGNVTLPFGIGGYENRDKEIIFIKEFEINDFEKAYIDFETVSPGGTIHLNGICILNISDGHSHRADVTSRLKNGKNRIVINVSPRAPGLSDTVGCEDGGYRDWFCGKIKMSLVPSVGKII